MSNSIPPPALQVLRIEELSLSDQQLLEEAKNISARAHAPYSNFLVGAAVLLSNGQMLKSSNQENVSFPAGLCAEHSLLSYAGANFPDSPPRSMAIVARPRASRSWVSIAPCGICRQVICEVEGRFGLPVKLLLLREDGRVCVVPGIDSLLPLKFDELPADDS